MPKIPFKLQYDFKMSFKNPESDCLRAFRACPGSPDQNLIQKLNHFVVSMDVYRHVKKPTLYLKQLSRYQDSKNLQYDSTGMCRTRTRKDFSQSCCFYKIVKKATEHHLKLKKHQWVRFLTKNKATLFWGYFQDFLLFRKIRLSDFYPYDTVTRNFTCNF